MGSSHGSILTSRCHVVLPSTEMDLPPLLSCNKALVLGTTAAVGQSSTVSLLLSSILPSCQLSSTEIMLFLVTHLAALWC